MKYRAKMVGETLNRLPLPEHKGQVLSVPLLTTTDHAFIGGGSEPNDMAETHLTVTAELFACGDRKWLEWVIEI